MFILLTNVEFILNLKQFQNDYKLTDQNLEVQRYKIFTTLI